MSLYDDERYTWRETYFVLFDDLRRRPRLEDLRRELQPYRETLQILDAVSNSEGRLRKLTVASYEDHSALEIVFRQGANVVAEMDALVQILEKGCSTKEKERLHAVKHWSLKFDVLHFEQTAGTAAFKIVKKPELSFPPPHSDVVLRDSFSTKPRADKLSRKSDKASKTDPSVRRSRFRFDANSYENCLAGGVGEEYARKIDRQEAEAETAESFERVDPNTLVLVLEILCRLTGGIALDPASGTIFQ